MNRTEGAPAKRWLLGVVFLLAMLSMNAGSASAHGFLVYSDPAANTVLVDTPIRVTMRFTEPLERTVSTTAMLYDQTGVEIDSTRVRFDDTDRHVMVLVLPGRLPNGTYSVVWQTLSAADGHQARGYIPFTIGTVNDVRSVVPPDLGSSAGPPDWLQATARWLSYLGLAITTGVFPVWLLVLRPAFSPAWQAGPRLTRRVRKIGYAGVGIALLGALLALAVQVAGARENAGTWDALSTTLTGTRFGRMWLLRVTALLASAVALMSAAWWWPRRQRALTVFTIGACALPALPFALVSHAAARTSGRSTAIAFDALHLLAVSIWIGGLIALVFGLLPALRDLTPAGRRVVLASGIRRFSAVALGSWAIIVVTGLYAGWLQVGSLTALRDTAYGTSLTIKLGLLLPVLALASFNLLVVSGKLRPADDDRATAIWGRRFATAIVSEVALVVVVLLVAGRLTSQPPAREAFAQEQNQVNISLDLSGRAAVLSLAPGKVGPNHYRLEVGGDPLPADTKALLRLTVPAVKAGVNQVSLSRVAGNAFETHGSEFSLAGTWSIDVIVRQVGGVSLTSTITTGIQVATPREQSRGAWVFRPSGIGGLLLIAAGFAALAFGWWSGRGTPRREGLGLGTVALALGTLLLVQARISIAAPGIPLNTPNPIPADSASIERGGALYQVNCAACHGVRGKGDGPSANDFSPPAADFTVAHAVAHLDAEFFNWIKNGKPPTAMPSFGDDLTNNEIWDVINFLRAIQRESGPPAASPIANPLATPIP